ncbi:MAG: TIGR00730 family Rossman fold protein [Ardenticatenales bacterium]|nr:TIGR00730 family Rossman fold protein [Ardenticatenales bacterium]
MTRPFSVAVYCSSSDHVDRAYFEAADALGLGLAARGWRLVFGAGRVGLMGAVAFATHRGGGKIYGVIPHALDRVELTYEECDELLRVETMRQRKALMEENADAYIALPGGLGTLEEIVEIIVLKQLRYIDRPIVLLNTAGYWEPLIALFEEMIQQQFLTLANPNLYQVVGTVDAALDYIASYSLMETPPLAGTDDEERVRTALE